MLNALKKGSAVHHRLWVFIACLFSSAASAAPLSPSDLNTIQQQQQHLLDQNQRQREEFERRMLLPHIAEPQKTPAPLTPCFIISRIEIDGATRLSRTAADRLTAPWLNQCLNIPRLTELTNAISDWYISRGYITSRAFLTEQDLSSGVLHIAVLEGKLQQIRLEGPAGAFAQKLTVWVVTG